MTNLKEGNYNFITKHQQKTFEHNIRTNKQIMIKLGWDTPESVEYKINSMGFRSYYDFKPNEPCNVYLGCSYTLGEEVQLDDCWTSLVNSHCNDYKMYNLGSLGASTITCYRILKNVSKLFDIKRVFIFKPYTDRKEIYYNDEWITFSMHRNIFKNTKNLLPFFDTNLVTLEKEMAIDGIRYICNTVNAKLYELDTDDQSIQRQIDTDRTARDLHHFGKKTHKIIANKFIEKIKND
jgi:hypothetical protein